MFLFSLRFFFLWILLFRILVVIAWVQSFSVVTIFGNVQAIFHAEMVSAQYWRNFCILFLTLFFSSTASVLFTNGSFDTFLNELKIWLLRDERLGNLIPVEIANFGKGKFWKRKSGHYEFRKSFWKIKVPQDWNFKMLEFGILRILENPGFANRKF